MSECEHKEFEASVTVNRLEDVKRFAADIHIQCRDCGMQFRFLGLPGGLHPERPTVSVDGTEARLPIALGDVPWLHLSNGQVSLQIDGSRLAQVLMPHIVREGEA